jgi:DNA polymerase-3 subunit delta
VRVNPEALGAALGKSLAGAYLICGEEPLLVEEAADAIRAAARGAGFTERKVFFIDRGFSWDELYAESRELSLFSEKRIVELRMPGKPDKKGAEVLIDLATHRASDVLLLMITGKLDKKASDAPWARAFSDKGVLVPIWPVEQDDLPLWLKERAERAKVSIEYEAALLIAMRSEGNLLAAAQELEKLLLLCKGGTISVELARDAVADSARYDVLQMAQAAAAGEGARALHILKGLRAEGTEPTLLLWSLVREIRGLWQATERSRLKSSAAGSGWNLASSPTPEALIHGKTLDLQMLLQSAADADLILKGQAQGEPWVAIAALTLSLAGGLPASMSSVR